MKKNLNQCVMPHYITRLESITVTITPEAYLLHYDLEFHFLDL